MELIYFFFTGLFAGGDTFVAFFYLEGLLHQWLCFREGDMYFFLRLSSCENIG